MKTYLCVVSIIISIALGVALINENTDIKRRAGKELARRAGWEKEIREKLLEAKRRDEERARRSEESTLWFLQTLKTTLREPGRVTAEEILNRYFEDDLQDAKLRIWYRERWLEEAKYGIEDNRRWRKEYDGMIKGP